MTKETSKPAIVIMTSLKAIKAETVRLGKVGSEYQADLHRLACSVLAHVATHRNLNVLLDFLNSVPDAVRKNSLQTWFETFGTVVYAPINEGEKATWQMLPVTNKPKLGDAMVKPFWKFKALEGAPYQPLNMDEYLNKQIRLLVKDKEERLKLDHNADVSLHNAMIMSMKTVGEPKH